MTILVEPEVKGSQRTRFETHSIWAADFGLAQAPAADDAEDGRFEGGSGVCVAVQVCTCCLLNGVSTRFSRLDKERALKQAN